MASKMGNTYKQTSYTLNSVEAFYLQSPGMPSMNDLAEMFALKFEKDGHLKEAPSLEGGHIAAEQDTP